MSIVKNELDRLKEYYDSLSWIGWLFFPGDIANIFEANTDLTGLSDESPYDEYCAYKKVKENIGWFSWFFYSGLAQFWTNTQEIDKTITYLEEHHLLNRERVLPTGDIFRIIVPSKGPDRDTTNAAKLLVFLDEARQVEGHNLDLHYGQDKFSATERIEELAVDLVAQERTLDELNLRTIVHVISQHERLYDIAPALVLMNRAGLLQGEAGLKNINVLGKCERPYDIVRILNVLLDKGLLSTLTQPMFDRIINSERPYAIAKCVRTLGVFLEQNNLNVILNLEAVPCDELSGALEIFMKTTIVSQSNLNSIFRMHMPNQYGDNNNQGSNYFHGLNKLYKSGALNCPEAQENFNRFNENFLRKGCSQEQLNSHQIHTELQLLEHSSAPGTVAELLQNNGMFKGAPVPSSKSGHSAELTFSI